MVTLTRQSDIPLRHACSGFLGISGGDLVLVWGKSETGASVMSAVTPAGESRWTIEIWDADKIAVVEALRDQVAFIFQPNSREQNAVWSVALDSGKIEKLADLPTVQ